MIRRAVITGATGAIGTALVDTLIKQNIEVLVFCRKGSERNSQLPKHPLVTLKYCNLDEIASVENDTGKDYDAFYHFAWAGTTGAARNDMYLQNLNVKYTLDAVAAAKRFGCRVFIGAGSQAEYGRAEGMLRSDTPTFPETGYGMAKLCGGMMSREYAHTLGLEHIWVRILSVYGPNDTKSSMVMSTIDKLSHNITPQLTKGEQLWDYLYSGDAAKAFYLLAEKGIDGKTYVLGSGKVRELKEYVNAIQSAVNPDCSIDFGAVPYSDKQVMHLQADITEIKNDTGFEPSVDFKDGIQSIIKAIN